MDLLRDKVENMRKRMGLDMFDELEDFENVVSGGLLDMQPWDAVLSGWVLGKTLSCGHVLVGWSHTNKRFNDHHHITRWHC